MQGVPINIDNLIHARSVEDNRREFKATWNDAVKESVVRSVCAFANDLLNLNGGYVILGIDIDEQGLPILPPLWSRSSRSRSYPKRDIRTV